MKKLFITLLLIGITFTSACAKDKRETQEYWMNLSGMEATKQSEAELLKCSNDYFVGSGGFNEPVMNLVEPGSKQWRICMTILSLVKYPGIPYEQIEQVEKENLKEYKKQKANR